MTTLYRTRVQWNGFPGSPGVSTFYGLVDTGMVGNLHTFLTALTSLLPSEVHLHIENSGDALEDTTGVLTGAWAADSVADVVGSGDNHYPAPVGFNVDWNSTAILDGHRLKGRTYFVPGAGGIYDTDGTILSGVLTTIQTAADGFLAAESGNLAIWHRPRAARAADATHLAVTARAGGHGVVTTCSARDKTVVLRSRRD